MFLSWFCPLILLSLLSSQTAAWSFQHTSNAICFDLEGNGGTDLQHEHTSCKIYVMNSGRIESEKGIENTDTDDCIRMNSPSPSAYTYIWTSCDDALWMDQIHIFAGDCAIGRRQLAERNAGRRKLWIGAVFELLFQGAMFTGDLAMIHAATTEPSHCQAYGADNQFGWCLSQDANDGKGDWKNYVDGSCFKLFRLGKPSQNDPRAWGYQTTWNLPTSNRRLLIESGVQAVKECEVDGTGSCEELAAKVMTHMVEDADAHQGGWTNLGNEREIQASFGLFDKDGSGEIDFEEFKFMVKTYMNGSPSEEDITRLTKLFQKADKDSNGSLSPKEFAALLGTTEEEISGGVEQDNSGGVEQDISGGVDQDVSGGIEEDGTEQDDSTNKTEQDTSMGTGTGGTATGTGGSGSGGRRKL